MVTTTNLPIRCEVVYHVTTYDNSRATQGFITSSHLKARLDLENRKFLFPKQFHHVRPQYKFIYKHD